MARTEATTEAAESSETLPEEMPPGPDGWPVVGNTIQFVRSPFDFYETLASYGDVVSYEVAGQQFSTILHPELVEQVLVTDSDSFRKWRFEEFGVEFAPEGVLQTEGEQWRHQRTVLQQAFRPDRIEGYADAMIEAASDLLDTWEDGETIALNDAFSRLTLRILAQTLFDLDVDGRGERVTSFTQTLQDRADPRSLSTFVPGWVPTPSNRRYFRELEQFRSLVDDLIEERRADGTDGDDLLSLLLDAEDDSGAGLTDEEIRDQLITFLFAGHDTTSLALTYTFLLLSTHEDARRKLDAEHEQVLGGDPPTLSDLPALSYTDQVISESLRLYPPAYILFREVEDDVELGGYRIPGGTKLTLPQFRIHMDERWYDDPESFQPERWTDEFEAELPEYAYFPFGGGPRHCIGMRFAMQELKLLVPMIAQRVSFDLVSDPNPDMTVAATLQPQEDVVARVSFE